MSATHSRLGATAVKLRSTKSPGRSAWAAGIVVRLPFPRMTPASPRARISRATRSRPTSQPSRRSCRHTLSTPYTPRFSSWTRSISVLSTPSWRARLEGGRLTAA